MITDSQAILLLTEIRKKGGLTTVDGYIDLNITKGYAVGTVGSVVHLYQHSIDWVDFKKTVNELLMYKKPSQYLGYWMDGDAIYIDIVLCIDSIELAMKVARLFNQTSIYSFKTRKCYTVNYDVKGFTELKKQTQKNLYKGV